MSNPPNPVNPSATRQTEPQRTQHQQPTQQGWPGRSGYPPQPGQPQHPVQPPYQQYPQHPEAGQPYYPSYQQPQQPYYPPSDQYQQQYQHQYPPQHQEHPQQSYENNPLNQLSGLDLDLKMEPHLAAALSYILFIVSGVAFLILERKSQFVRFHAMQSILFTATWFICSIGSAVVMMILGMAAAIIGFSGPLRMLGSAMNLVYIGFFIVWILLMVKAYQGDKWKLPIIGELAEKHANRL